MQTFKAAAEIKNLQTRTSSSGGGGGGVVTVSEEESQYEHDIATEDIGIEENVGETSFEMCASAANSSGQDNNEVKIEKELGEAYSAEENVPNEQESDKNA